LESFMKALLALAIIYIGTFFFVSQGISQSPSSASGTDTSAQAMKTIDNPVGGVDLAEETDIRALLELVGAKDTLQDAANAGIEQMREKLAESVPANEHGQAFVIAFTASYQKKFDANSVTEQLVGIYGKHFSDEEIKGLLQFYGSPLGQKVAAEMPKITREVQAVTRAASTKAAKEALGEVKKQNPEVGQSARLGNGQPRWQQRARGQQLSQQGQQHQQQAQP
jgi:hypothetical protein